MKPSRKNSQPWLIPYFPECPVEEMANGFVPHLGIGHHDVLKPVFTLEEADGPLEERLREGRIDYIRRVVSEHLGHILVEDVPVMRSRQSAEHPIFRIN